MSPQPLAGHPYYRYVSDLGTGGYGSVVLATDTRDNAQYAVKLVPFSRVRSAKLEREIDIMRQLSSGHHHIIQLKEVIEWDRHVGIVMEYASQGALLEYIQTQHRHMARGIATPFTSKEHMARWFFQQLIVALDFCHAMGVLQRDIKLENCLLSPGPNNMPILKLTDFNLSKSEAYHSRPDSRVGTIYYMPPELLVAQDNTTYDGRAVDMWCCGVMLYTMLTSRFPFPAPRGSANNMAAAVLQAIESGNWTPPSDCSEPCLNLLKRLLEPNPLRRMKLADVFKDPWFSVGLPPGSEDYKCHFLQRASHVTQRRDEVTRILQHAVTAAQDNLINQTFENNSWSRDDMQ